MPADAPLACGRPKACAILRNKAVKKAPQGGHFFRLDPRLRGDDGSLRQQAAKAYRHLITGCVSNVWNGGGLGSVHPSVVPPSHCLSGHGLPYFSVFQTTIRKITAEPAPIYEPIEET